MKNILVVDDEIVQIETLRRGLRTRGYKVFDALNGRDALRHLQGDEKIDIIITDYAMPEMTGMELLAKIREIHKKLPVIMMTAYGDKKLMLEAKHLRCDGFIAKPFTLDALLEEINRKLV